ncbi:hypothetical protein MYX07_00435 [Patescibacteria group bacterium AH-259-L07]|nr:hypothetical protein [Patescibacteria group bacterium AH-259-L07]
MPDKISPKNNEQDRQLAKVEQRVEDWFVLFDKFIINDFHSLKKRVEKIDIRVWGILITLITILLGVIGILVKLFK